MLMANASNIGPREQTLEKYHVCDIACNKDFELSCTVADRIVTIM